MFLFQSSIIKSKLTPEHFKSSYWDKDTLSTPLSGGRGGSLKICIDGQPYVLKEYLRGGLFAKILHNKYFWLGELNTRPNLEKLVLEHALKFGLPVPKCVAYYVEKKGLFYQATMMTQFIPNIGTLASYLENKALTEFQWKILAALVKSFHATKINHVDLNADNILLHDNNDELSFTIIDFDKARIEPNEKKWPVANIMRLQRSLLKIKPKYFDDNALTLFNDAFKV